MSLASKSPHDLALVVRSKLGRNNPERPSLEVLSALFECMFYVSMLTEESEPIRFEVVFLDPLHPDPDPPKRIARDRWVFVPLGTPIPLTNSNIVQLAMASDSRSSSIAVHGTSIHDLSIWGLVDQGNHHFEFINRESERGPQRPGQFHASIVGTGHIQVGIQYHRIAELRLNELMETPIDVFHEGPVSEELSPGIYGHIGRACKARDEGVGYPDEITINYLGRTWLGTLCRILIRSQRYRHGGALLITSEQSLSDLNIKYAMSYSRLRTSIDGHGSSSMNNFYYSSKIIKDYLIAHKDTIPMKVHRDDRVNKNVLEEIRGELEGATWFVSLLTRIDGLVLMNHDLDVLGFGVEIRTYEDPENVYIAHDPNAQDGSLTVADYNHFGTRHRSMMRYCYKYPGSVGFVISQDGYVRAITRVGDKLVMWENIRLQTFIEEPILSGRRQWRRRESPLIEAD